MRNRAVFTQVGFGLGYRFLHCGKGFEAHTSSCVWVLGASQKRSAQVFQRKRPLPPQDQRVGAMEPVGIAVLVHIFAAMGEILGI